MIISQVTGGNFEMGGGGGGDALGSESDGAAAENEVQKSEANAMFEVRPGLAVEASIFDELLSARKLELLNDPVREFKVALYSTFSGILNFSQTATPSVSLAGNFGPTETDVQRQAEREGGEEGRGSVRGDRGVRRRRRQRVLGRKKVRNAILQSNPVSCPAMKMPIATSPPNPPLLLPPIKGPLRSTPLIPGTRGRC